jgi:hypothetical protein
MATADSIRALLTEFDDVDIEPLAADLSGSVEQVWQLFGETYLFEMIPAALRPAFEREAASILASLRGPDGVVPCVLDLLTIYCKARSASPNRGSAA